MIGPRKLILIGSAGYGYAEVDLDRPIHIVAGNNMGKTSIINALQFLYVDSERAMSFGENDRLKTRKHYFDGEPGLIIFECQTPRRRMLVGVRSEGALAGFGFERWCCEGEYDSALFLHDNGMPRPWSDVVADLATFRKYKPLNSREMRQALTGTGTVPNLGLVPLRANVEFELFRERFVDILHLNRINGDDLKKSIIGICRGESTFRDEIDLQGTYQETFHGARRDRDAAREFEAYLPEITRLSEDLSAYQDSLPRLVREWRSIDATLSKEMERINARIAAIRDQNDGLAARIEAAAARYHKAAAAMESASARRGAIEAKVEDVQSRKRQFGHHDQNELEREDASAAAHVASLESALRDAASEGLSVATRRVDQAKRSVADAKRALAALDKPIILDWMHEKGFVDAEIEIVSKVVNPRLLMMERDREFAIEDEAALEHQIRSILAVVDEDRLLAPSYEIDLSGVDAMSTSRPDRVAIEADLRRSTEALQAAEDALTAVRERERVEADLAQAKNARDANSILLGEVRRLKADLSDLPEIQMSLLHAQEAETSAKAALEEAGDHRDQIRGEGDRLRREAAEAESDRSALNTAMRSVVMTEDDHVEGNAGPIDGHELHDRIRSYRHSRTRLEDQRLSINASHATLSKHLTMLPTDYVLMAEALEEAEVEGRAKIETAGKSWKTLLGTLTTSIRHLKEAYSTVERKVDSLNGNLRNVKVSDLRHIRFRVDAKRSDLDMLDEFLATRASDDDMFLDREAQADADRRVEIMLQRGRLRIIDMFTLGVEVDKNGTNMRYPSLDKIESNGTGITIKIVMGLLILKSLLRIEGQRIPYYIDETGTLDDDNLGEIIKFGLERGFVAILASPDPKSAAPVHYFPERHDGRSWIMDQHRVDRIQEPELVPEAAE